MKEPLVSICCLTYNHGKYITRCLEGFVTQKTNFLFEVLIHDDASTDNTADIIKEYQVKYPDIIKPILQLENQYSRGVRSISLIYNFPRAKGKYIAMCEGDDFWTTSDKLQKQVDFLEKNPDYSMSCGGYISRNTITGEERTVIQSKRQDDTREGFTFSLDDTKSAWLTKTLTALCRKDAFDIEFFKKYAHFRDIHLFYHVLSRGKGYYFKEVFGVYNIHPGGVNSMHQGKVNTNAAYNAYKELHAHHKNEFTRGRALKATLALFNYDMYNKYDGNTMKRRLRLFKEAVKLVKKRSEVKWLVNMFVPRTLKDNLKEKN